MNKVVVALFVVAVAAGCQAPAQPYMPNPSVSAITPAKAFLERTLDVELAGYATAWADSTTVDFGPGIKVNKVSAASATGLVANITVGVEAAVGARDVTVTDGKSQETFKGAFNVESPVEVSIVGDAAQGSIFYVHVENKDLEHLFDTGGVAQGFSFIYTNLRLDVPPGSEALATNVTPFNADFEVHSDVKAAAGKLDAKFVSGPEGGSNLVKFTAPQAINIVERSATVLGASASIDVSHASQSFLFSFSPANTTGALTTLQLAAGSMASPSFIVLGASGKFADRVSGLVAATRLATLGSEQFYVVVVDDGTVASYSGSLKRTEVVARASMEAEPNDMSKPAALGDCSKPVLVGASLADGSDEDWFAFDATAAMKDKKVYVTTYAGDRLTDTVVEIFASDKTTSLGASTDQGYLDAVASKALPAQAATYYIKVSASDQFDPAHKSYIVGVEIK